MCPDASEQTSGTSRKTYLKIFAVLLYQEKVVQLPKFVDDQVCDQDLPLQLDRDMRLHRRETPQYPGCFDGWRPHERRAFEEEQWCFLVPFLAPSENLEPQHYSFTSKTILPWSPKDENPRLPGLPSREIGGYAVVTYVKIDPLSHGFHEILRSVRIVFKGSLPPRRLTSIFLPRSHQTTHCWL